MKKLNNRRVAIKVITIYKRAAIKAITTFSNMDFRMNQIVRELQIKKSFQATLPDFYSDKII